MQNINRQFESLYSILIKNRESVISWLSVMKASCKYSLLSQVRTDEGRGSQLQRKCHWSQERYQHSIRISFTSSQESVNPGTIMRWGQTGPSQAKEQCIRFAIIPPHEKHQQVTLLADGSPWLRRTRIAYSEHRLHTEVVDYYTLHPSLFSNTQGHKENVFQNHYSLEAWPTHAFYVWHSL